MSVVTANSVKLARDHALLNVKSLKCQIVAHVESGDRDWTALRRLVDCYADAQNAADVLSGQATVASSCEA